MADNVLIEEVQNSKADDNLSFPLSLPEFLKQNIPPLEFYVMDILPKKGKGLISAPPNLGKSLLVQNMALYMASGSQKFMGKFDILPARVLYLDLEMGESALKERFQKMCNASSLAGENLYLHHEPALNLLDEGTKAKVENWIIQLKIGVIIFDPIGNAWLGNENDSEKVRALTGYLNTLIDKYSVSVLLVHHWRKATKDNRTGGQMAAGSYRWEAWADCHVTLEGQNTSTTISCHKNRNRPKFSPFLVKLNEDSLCFEFIGDYQKQYDKNTLEALFDSFNTPRVAITNLIERAKEQKQGSETTLRKLIKETTVFSTDKTQKTHYLMRKSDENIQNIDWKE